MRYWLDFLFYQLRRFFNQDILLPTLISPLIFPCNISWSILYCRLFLIICPIYSSFRACIVVKSFLSFPIIYSILWLVTRSVQEIYSIRLYNHIAKASIFFHVNSVSVQVSTPYSIAEKTTSWQTDFCITK